MTNLDWSSLAIAFNEANKGIEKMYKRGELEPWMVEYADFSYMGDYVVDGPYKVEVTVDGFDVSVYIKPVIDDRLVDLTKLSVREVYSDYVGVYGSDSRWSAFTDLRTSRNEVIALAQYFAAAINENHYRTFYNNFPLEEVKKNFYKCVRDSIVENNGLLVAGRESLFKEEVSFDGIEKINVRVSDYEYFRVVAWRNLLAWRNRNFV